MRIGILGSGTVGMSLAEGFVRDGYETLLGSRTPTAERVAAFAASAPLAGAGTYRQAAKFGDVVIAAVPGRMVVETVEQIGADAFEGKILIDTTNPVGRSAEGTFAIYGDDDSVAENLQRLLPETHVVKAFNQINAERMTDPDAAPGPTHTRIAGDDPASKQVVTQILEGFGWTVQDLGDLTHARGLEHSVVKWFVKRDDE